MLTFLDTLMGLVAPHECMACGLEGSLLCNGCVQLLTPPVPRCYRCGRTDGGWRTCTACRKHSPLGKVMVVTLYEGFGEVVVHKLKFERAYAAHAPIARAMVPLTEGYSTIVPVPTATSRVRQRGYDQAVLLARAISKRSGVHYMSMLERFGQERQTGSNRTERLRQLDAAFGAISPAGIAPEHVLLVDDILTTGATFEAAARVLKHAGVKHIDALAFARAE